jgi:hypothetical protein
MKKETIEKIIRVLENANIDAKKMWDEKTESHASIVGYLKGINIGLIGFLKEELDK